MKQNSFYGKSWYPPPLSSLALFDTRSFLKHRRVFQRIFRQCEKENFWLKSWIFFLPPPIHKIFRYYFFSETQKVSPTVFFDTVRHRLFDGKLWCPVFFYPRNFSLPEFCWKIERTMYKVFGTVRRKISNGIWWYPLPMQKMFGYQKLSETRKGSPTMFFDTVRHQLFDGKVWCPLFLLSFKIFDARSFLKLRRDHLQSFSGLWDKRFPTELSDFPLLCKRCFDTRIYLKHGGGPLRLFSALWDKVSSIKISDMPFFCIKFFDIRFFLEHRRVRLRKILVLWDKSLEKKSWQTPSSLIKKNCGTRNFLKHRSVSARTFSALWNKKISTDNSEFPLLSVNFYDTRFFLQHRRFALRKISVLWDSDFDKKSWYTLLFSYP